MIDIVFLEGSNFAQRLRCYQQTYYILKSVGCYSELWRLKVSIFQRIISMVIVKPEKRVVFFTMVRHPSKGWTRCGNAYGSRDEAKGWLRFIRGYWRGCRVMVSQCTLFLENGSVCEKSKCLLDSKYNLDA